MLKTVSKKIFGSPNDRFLKGLRPTVVRVNDLEEEISKLSDDELGRSTAKFRERLDNGEPLDDLIPEAFATVREAGKRVLAMRHPRANSGTGA